MYIVLSMCLLFPLAIRVFLFWDCSYVITFVPSHRTRKYLHAEEQEESKLNTTLCLINNHNHPEHRGKTILLPFLSTETEPDIGCRLRIQSSALQITVNYTYNNGYRPSWYCCRLSRSTATLACMVTDWLNRQHRKGNW